MAQQESMPFTCPKMLGGLLYLQRCTRPDLAFAIGKLARFTSRWTKLCSRALLRLISYIFRTRFEALLFRGNQQDGSDDGSNPRLPRPLFLMCFVDADHAGEVASGHSTSGAVLFLVSDDGMQCPIAWRSKKQSATAHSTAEAEIIAASDGLRWLLLPMAGTLDSIMGSALVSSVVLGDAMVAERCIKKGWSKALKHLRKCQRVSLCFLHDVFEDESNGITFQHVSSEGNTSDAMTNALPKLTSVRRAYMLGLRQASEI